MGDRISRFISLAQDPTAPESERAWASGELMKEKQTRDRLSNLASDGKADPAERDWARSEMLKRAAPMPITPMMKTAPADSPTAQDEALGLASGPQASNFKDLGETHPLLSAALSRGGERAQDQAALNDLTPEDRKKMNTMVGGALIGAGAGALAAPYAAVLGAEGLGGLLGASATGGVSGYAQGAGEGLLEGKSLRDAHNQGVESGKVGLVAGPFAHMVGENIVAPLAPLARKGQDLLRQNRWIGGKAAAEEAGMYTDPAMQGLPSGLEGERRASEVARDRITARDAAMTQEAGAKHAAAVAAEGHKVADLQPAIDELYGVQAGTRYSAGDPMRDRAGISKAVDATFDDLTRQGPNGRTVKDIVEARRAAGESAGFGTQSPTEAQLAQQRIYEAHRAAVRKSAPGVATADDQFTAFKQGQEHRNDILYRSEEGGRPVEIPQSHDPAILEPNKAVPLRMRVGDEIKAATAISRVGDDTAEGLRMAPYLEELGKQDPEFAKALQFMDAKKSLEATRFHFRDMLPNNLHDATAHIAGLPMGFLRQNARALGSTADSALGHIGPAMENGRQLGVNPIVRALIIEKARDMQNADRVKAGGR